MYAITERLIMFGVANYKNSCPLHVIIPRVGHKYECLLRGVIDQGEYDEVPTSVSVMYDAVSAER